MHIQDNIGDVIFKVGMPSINHVRIFVDGELENAIELSFIQWQELKTKIDKMFTVAKGLSDKA